VVALVEDFVYQPCNLWAHGEKLVEGIIGGERVAAASVVYVEGTNAAQRFEIVFQHLQSQLIGEFFSPSGKVPRRGADLQWLRCEQGDWRVGREEYSSTVGCLDSDLAAADDANLSIDIECRWRRELNRRRWYLCCHRVRQLRGRRHRGDVRRRLGIGIGVLVVAAANGVV
jgi:hypothetical protein